MSIISRPDYEHNTDVNLIAAKKALIAKVQEINPVAEFYRELHRGWENRLRFASVALAQIPETDTRNREILTKLVSVASYEKSEALKTLKTVDKARQDLEQKIQDLDFVVLKNIRQHGAKTIDIGINDINRLLYVSDALLELRNMERKRIH